MKHHTNGSLDKETTTVSFGKETTTGSRDTQGLHHEQVVPKRRRGCLGHLKRFWWAYLIIFIIVVLVVLLPLIFVGFPKIAQDQVNAATAEITSIKLTNPTPTSFHIVQDGFSNTDSNFHPFLDAFNASISMAGAAAYGLVEIPGIYSDAHVAVRAEQDVQIIDLQAYTDYNVKVLTSETFEQRLNGTTTLHQSGLPATTINYDKTVTMKGFNAFPGFNITCLKIDNGAPAGQSNINGTVFVPNPSNLAVELGDVTYNAYIGDEMIANTTIQDFYLQPGNHSYWFTGHANTLAIIGLISKYPDGIVPMTVKGNASIANGEHLTYYEAALAKDVHTLRFNILGAATVKECAKP